MMHAYIFMSCKSCKKYYLGKILFKQNLAEKGQNMPSLNQRPDCFEDRSLLKDLAPGRNFFSTLFNS